MIRQSPFCPKKPLHCTVLTFLRSMNRNEKVQAISNMAPKNKYTHAMIEGLVLNMEQLFVEVRHQDLLPDLIPLLVHVEFIAKKQAVDGLTRRTQHRMIDIRKRSVAVLGHEI